MSTAKLQPVTVICEKRDFEMMVPVERSISITHDLRVGHPLVYGNNVVTRPVVAVMKIRPRFTPWGNNEYMALTQDLKYYLVRLSA